MWTDFCPFGARHSPARSGRHQLRYTYRVHVLPADRPKPATLGGVTFEGLFQPIHLLIIGVFFVIFVIPWVFYILCLERALQRCSPASRAMPPGRVWLLLIPIFGLVWHFIVVSDMARSLGNEFKSRNVQNVDPAPGKSVGLAMCILSVCGLIPLIGVVLSMGAIVCWIVYWVRIATYSEALRTPSLLGAPPS